MRHSFVYVLSTAAIGAMIALSAPAAFAKTVKECDAEYSANKDAIKASGQTKKDYVAACRAGTAATPTAAPAAPPAAAPAPAAPPTTAAAPAAGKSAKECNAEYSENKAAIKATGQKKSDFVAACRAGTEVVPTAAAPAASAPAPAAQAPAPAPSAPAPMAPRPAAPMTASEAQAQASCPSDIVVWVNTKSGIYHFKGTHNYGNTKQGTYMCESAAKTAGDRAAENEKHP
jgi:pyruvate/2-oxoglutarate dehydrogenase complex dihydrolipoamide acyltransferase (E2) component